jgi:hypothetical protein
MPRAKPKPAPADEAPQRIGRPPTDPDGAIRVDFSAMVHPHTRELLADLKAATGKSYGVITDEAIAAYSKVSSRNKARG